MKMERRYIHDLLDNRYFFFETYTETSILSLLEDFDFDIEKFKEHLKDSQIVRNRTGNIHIFENLLCFEKTSKV